MTPITKTEAARRQINEAIRMLLRGADPLPVHTVAGAATKLLEELHKKQSRNPMQEQLATGMLRVVQDYLRGNQLSKRMFNFAQHLSSNLSNELKRSLADNDISDISPSEMANLAKSFPKTLADQVRSELFKTINFLKHSDRDADARLLENQFDNILLIYHAIKSYESLGLQPTIEMTVFIVYWLAHCDWHDSYLPQSITNHLKQVRGRGEPEVRAYCLSMINQPSV